MVEFAHAAVNGITLVVKLLGINTKCNIGRSMPGLSGHCCNVNVRVSHDRFIFDFR